MKKQLSIQENWALAVQMVDQIERELAEVAKESSAQIGQDHDLVQQKAFVALTKKTKMLWAEHEAFKAKADYFGSLVLAGFKTEKEAKNALNRAIAQAMS
jgi:hypothetical protein